VEKGKEKMFQTNQIKLEENDCDKIVYNHQMSAFKKFPKLFIQLQSSYRMKLSFLQMFIFLTLPLYTSLASPLPRRYVDPVFDTTDSRKDIQYGINTNYLGKTDTLKLDFYEPAGDLLLMRPLILFIHGGSFLSGTRQLMEPECIEMAKRGYATATISYRLGKDNTNSDLKKVYFEAALRAIQDAKAAVRFFKSRKSEYRIDPDKVILGGFSAGASTVLHYAYVDSAEASVVLDLLKYGGFEGTSGTPGESSSIRAIIALAGPLADSTYMTHEKIPVCVIQGTEDSYVPLDVGPEDAELHLCMCGALAINRFAKREGIFSVLKLFDGMDHFVPLDPDPRSDTLFSIMSKFCFDVLFVNSTITPQLHKRPIATQPYYLYVNMRYRQNRQDAKTLYTISGRQLSEISIHTRLQYLTPGIYIRKK
jgi:acetyl esterase/lipase